VDLGTKLPQAGVKRVVPIQLIGIVECSDSVAGRALVCQRACKLDWMRKCEQLGKVDIETKAEKVWYDHARHPVQGLEGLVCRVVAGMMRARVRYEYAPRAVGCSDGMRFVDIGVQDMIHGF
jgi:hypothetical protein